MPDVESIRWSQRAAAAEAAVVARHLRPLWGLPGTTLGVVGWPPNPVDRRFVRWHYWWQAHLIDCLVDAQWRSPEVGRTKLIAAVARGIRWRNGRRWTNNYYDDMAWLGIALERCRDLGLPNLDLPIAQLSAELLGAWSEADGGIPWRKGDSFRNAPANGPAAILLARLGHLERARQTADWLDATLRDPATGLVFDGIRGDGRLEREFYTYCQGVLLGAETELAVRMPGTNTESVEHRIDVLVTAVDRHLATEGVLQGRGGGDGGLFAGILARYLALVVTELAATTARGRHAVELARALVTASAEAAWGHRVEVDGRPLFGPHWDTPARVPVIVTAGRRVDGAVPSSSEPARDLSVQLSGWMLLEAAATLERRPAPDEV